MKHRWIAAYLALIAAVALVPLRAVGETPDLFKSKAGAELPLPPEDDQSEPVAADQKQKMPADNNPDNESIAPPPSATAEPATRTETGPRPAAAPQGEPSATTPATSESISQPDQSATSPAAPVITPEVSPEGELTGRSWWGNFMAMLGFGGNSPSAEPAAPRADKSRWSNFMYKLGVGADPQPGETVQTPTGRAESSSDYIIGPGDVIGISVWRDDNLSKTVVVLSDGKISFPLIGEMVAGGKTVAQLKQELQGKLSRFISDTGITVEVKQSNSMIIYVVGKVNAPGKQMLLANTNVLQAIAMVGGLNIFADKSNIKIFRQEAGKTIMYTFNYDEVSDGRHLETNIELKRGDVIIVP